MILTLIEVLLVAVVIGLLVIAAGLFKSGRRGGPAADDERKIIQDIHQGLTRLEERVEALETLLLDAKRKER